jgi:TPP-dependent trihydroxycyclohexane-1,2-dione (THcHDO) dehydratase
VPPDLALVDELVAMILGAERPVVIRGRSASWSGARSTLGAPAEESGALMPTIQIHGGCEFA